MLRDEPRLGGRPPRSSAKWMDLSVKVPSPLQIIFHEQAKSIIAIRVSEAVIKCWEESLTREKRVYH